MGGPYSEHRFFGVYIYIYLKDIYIYIPWNICMVVSMHVCMDWCMMSDVIFQVFEMCFKL